MKHFIQPEIGKWFYSQDFRDSFEVVASDESEDYVEVQYFSGEIEEFDLDTWYQLNLSRIPAPEDCSGPYELSYEDLGYLDDAVHLDDWSNPLNEIEPDIFY